MDRRQFLPSLFALVMSFFGLGSLPGEDQPPEEATKETYYFIAPNGEKVFVESWKDKDGFFHTQFRQDNKHYYFYWPEPTKGELIRLKQIFDMQ